MRTLTLLVAILAAVTFAAEAVAQTQVPPPAGQSSPPVGAPAQGEEKTVEGQVAGVDASRTEITLADGTRLVTPLGVAISPGVLTQGMTVVASYREENGEKVLTELAVRGEKPSRPPTRN
jgi:hypothetical protein